MFVCVETVHTENTHRTASLCGSSVGLHIEALARCAAAWNFRFFALYIYNIITYLFTCMLVMLGRLRWPERLSDVCLCWHGNHGACSAPCVSRTCSEDRPHGSRYQHASTTYICVRSGYTICCAVVYSTCHANFSQVCRRKMHASKHQPTVYHSPAYSWMCV